MKLFNKKSKILALVLTLAFTFQSLHSINAHTYSTGFDNIHQDFSFSCFIGTLPHTSYDCGQAFHIY